MASNGGIMRRGTPAGDMETSADVHMDTLSPESIGMYILIVVTTTVNVSTSIALTNIYHFTVSHTTGELSGIVFAQRL